LLTHPAPLSTFKSKKKQVERFRRNLQKRLLIHEKN